MSLLFCIIATDYTDFLRFKFHRISKKDEGGENYILTGHGASIKEIALWVHQFGAYAPPKLSVSIKVTKLDIPFFGIYTKLTNTRPLKDTVRDTLLKQNGYVF